MKDKIAGYRKMLGFTQAELAKELNISVTAYFNKEHGVTPFSDKEKMIVKNMLKEIDENISIDKIFF